MLNLTRKVGESVMIGDEITITVLAIKGGQVRVGITAPKNIKILREELLDRTDQQAIPTLYERTP